MQKIEKHKQYIQKFIPEINDKEIYTTFTLKDKKLFVSMKTGDYNNRIIYAVISSGILKVKKELNGTSQRLPKIYFSGKNLKEALLKYYNL